MLSLNIAIACSHIGAINSVSGSAGCWFSLRALRAMFTAWSRHALEIGGKLHRRNDPAQIGRDRLKTEQEIDSILVDLLFELIDLFVVGDRVRAKIVVALQQAVDGAIEAAFGQARHHQDVVAQGSERFVESAEDMFRRDHCGS